MIAAMLMIAFCINGIAQTSARSTQTDGSNGASDEQLVAQLVAEVKAGRDAVAALRAENEALTAQLKAEQANAASLQRSYDAAEREIKANERAIAHLEKAIELHEKTVETLQVAYDKEKASNKKNKKRAAVATIIAIASLALRFL